MVVLDTETKKKLIVFIEPKPTVYNYRIARSLKLTGKYKTILVSFSGVDKEFYGKAYDEIKTLQLSHKLRLKDLFDLSRKALRGEIKKFFKEINKMTPYLFQITGPDFFSLMSLHLLRKNPALKIYYANDLWGADQRNFFFTKNFWIKGEMQKFFEKLCFKRIDGILSKMSLEEFELLHYSMHVPRIILPRCGLDEWMFPPKQKKNKEIHIVYAGSPNPLGNEKISMMDVVKIITSQGIYFHTYGSSLNKKENQTFIDEAKRNEYYFNHEKVTPSELNKELSQYDYGIFPEFIEQSKVDSNPTMATTQLASKLINYVESGLPILVNSQMAYMTKIVETNNIGWGIAPEDLENFGKVLRKTNYSQLQKNLKKFQMEFKLSKKIMHVEAFYEKLWETKKINS